MITRQEFENGAKVVQNNVMAALPKMINYKKYIQGKIIGIATRKELEDVRDCIINQGMIDKLVRLAKHAMLTSRDAQSFYCAAMAIGTIIKEYEWDTYYITMTGMYELVTRIETA